MTFLGLDFKQLNINHKQSPEGICGIQFTPEGIAVAFITHQDKSPRLQHYDFLPCEYKFEKILTVLSNFVSRHQLEGVSCSLVLQPQDYFLLSVGILPVASNEIKQALYFHIKDRIPFSISKAVITHFTLPSINKNSKDEFIYAVVSQKDFLENTAHTIRQSGLNLVTVDIPEFALRNVVTLQTNQTEPAKNAGVIEINENQMILMFIQSGVIQLIRQIEYDKKLSSEENIKKLSSEIQRSLNYYENELGQTPINRFYIPPYHQKFFQEFATILPFELVELNLESLMNLTPNNEKNIHCFIAIGAALQNENTYATAN